MMAKSRRRSRTQAGERGEYAEGGGENDERGGGEQSGASFAEHARFAFHDLANRANIGGRQIAAPVGPSWRSNRRRTH